MYIPSFSRTPKGFQTQPVTRREHPDSIRRHSSVGNADDSGLIAPPTKPSEIHIHHSQSFSSTTNTHPLSHVELEAPSFDQNKIRMAFLKFFVSIMKDVNKYLVTGFTFMTLLLIYNYWTNFPIVFIGTF